MLAGFPFYTLCLKILSYLPLDWAAISRVVWYFPILILALYSSWRLIGDLYPRGKLNILAPGLYLFNPYMLMIVGGGQISVALAYAVAPLVLSYLIKRSSWGILFLVIQFSFEPEFPY